MLLSQFEQVDAQVNGAVCWAWALPNQSAKEIAINTTVKTRFRILPLDSKLSIYAGTDDRLA